MIRARSFTNTMSLCILRMQEMKPLVGIKKHALSGPDGVNVWSVLVDEADLEVTGQTPIGGQNMERIRADLHVAEFTLPHSAYPACTAFSHRNKPLPALHFEVWKFPHGSSQNIEMRKKHYTAQPASQHQASLQQILRAPLHVELCLNKAFQALPQPTKPCKVSFTKNDEGSV